MNQSTNLRQVYTFPILVLRLFAGGQVMRKRPASLLAVVSSVFSNIKAVCLVVFAAVAFLAGSPIRAGGLTKGSDGNFYGMTPNGGEYGYGTVFKMTPAGVITTLVEFDGGSTGAYAVGGLVEGNDGSFYGMTQYGGDPSYSLGTIFKVTPAGVYTKLKDFRIFDEEGNFVADGMNPEGSLLKGGDGNFYGMTPYGGENGVGTVFKITPTGVFTTLVHFNGGNGDTPFGSLVLGDDGNFYGMTSGNGGGGNFSGGTVFKVTPAGVIATLVNFMGTNGALPMGSLVKGDDGNFYGMTRLGGAGLLMNYGQGTVFKVTPAGVHTKLLDFTHLDTNGYQPRGSFVKGSDGNFYGMTAYGGTGYGTTIKVTPAGVLTRVGDFGTVTHDNSLVEASPGVFYALSGDSSIVKRINTTPPEIAVEQPAGTGIASGGSKGFGSVDTGSSADLTFTITNTGVGALNLSGTPKVAVTGSNAADFSIVTQPESPVSVGGSTTFVARFSPTSTGAKNAVLTIANDDEDEGAYIVNVSGTGTTPPPPLPPIITDVSPNNGPTTGGTSVVISGANFGGSPTVTIGGNAATITASSPSSITATPPAHAPGTVNLVVTAAGMTSAPATFIYVALPPIITDVSPNNGPTTGGTSVVISGANFGGSPTVTIGGNAATITASSPSSITVTTPTHAPGTVDVAVTASGTSVTGSGLFTYTVGNVAPTDIALSVNSIAENNTPGATIGTLSATDADAGQTHTFTFAGGADDAAFTITGSTLIINGSADFETKPSYAIRIRATDNGTPTESYEKSFTVTITDVTLPQTITFAPLGGKTFGDADFTVSATGGASGQPVTFAISGPATITGNTVSITGAGDVTVTASQSGNGDYSAASGVARMFTVAKAAQSITFSPPATALPTDSVTLTATGGASGNVVTFSVFSGPGSISGNTLTFSAEGDVVVRASQDGNENYEDAPAVDATIEVSLNTAVDDAVTTTTGTTRIYPLANDSDPNATITSVDEGLVTIDGRSLIIPQGYAGTFTYTTSVGHTATVTVSAGTPVVGTKKWQGLLYDAGGNVAGIVSATKSVTSASVSVTIGATTKRARILLAGATNVAFSLGTISGSLGLDDRFDITVVSSGETYNALLRPQVIGAVPVKYNIALAGADVSVVPGGGFMRVSVGSGGRLIVTGRLPDGRAFSAGSALLDNGSFLVYRGISGTTPRAFIGGELITADLTATDVTGEFRWNLPAQATGLHADGVDTTLVANGSLFTAGSLLDGAVEMKLIGADLSSSIVVPDTTASNGKIPATEDSEGLISFIGNTGKGTFAATIKHPDIANPVRSTGVFLQKSNTAWGHLPGVTIGGAISLKQE